MQTIINGTKIKQMYFRKRGNAFTIEGENYTEGAYVAAYTKNEYPNQAAVQLKYATDAFAVYKMNVPNVGYYEVSTIGNGTPTEGYIKGDLYIDDTWVSSTMLENGNGWNVFANPYQSSLGIVRLSAGEHTIKFVVNGGSYVMDKIIFTPRTVTRTLILEAENYYIQKNIEEYSKPEDYPGRSAVLVGRNGSKPSSITWGVMTKSEGSYDVSVYGNGVVYAEGGDTDIVARLYVDNDVKLTKDLTISGAWNIFDDEKCLKSELGSVDLTAGTHTIKLELESGSYVLDKVILELPDAETDSDDEEASEYVPYKKVYADGVLVFSAEEYIYSGYGTLAEGVTLSGMTEYNANGGGLYKLVRDNADNDGQWNTNPTTATVKICGVDLTHFNTLSIKNGASNDGEPDTSWLTQGAGGYSRVYWGIDSVDTSLALLAGEDSYSGEKEYTGEMDISGYTGVHDIVFYLSTLDHYDDGADSRVTLYLQEVKLY